MAVVQAVMLYRLETWVMTPRIGRVLGGFHHRVARRLTGQHPRRGQDGGWVYLPLAEAMAETGLQEVETYVSRRQNTVATRPIMDLCLAAEQRPGSRVAKRWWEQDGLDLDRMRTVDQEAERIEGEEETDRTVTETD